jgi:hypothetical protein
MQLEVGHSLVQAGREDKRSQSSVCAETAKAAENKKLTADRSSL